jgi:hypothetical protein
MNRTILGGALLGLLLGAPLLASAANDDTTFGALKNFNSASQEVVSSENTSLSPMVDGDLAKVEGGSHDTSVYIYGNSTQINVNDFALAVIQANVFGNNRVVFE